MDDSEAANVGSVGSLVSVPDLGLTEAGGPDQSGPSLALNSPFVSPFNSISANVSPGPPPQSAQIPDFEPSAPFR